MQGRNFGQNRTRSQELHLANLHRRRRQDYLAADALQLAYHEFHELCSLTHKQAVYLQVAVFAVGIIAELEARAICARLEDLGDKFFKYRHTFRSYPMCTIAERQSFFKVYKFLRCISFYLREVHFVCNRRIKTITAGWNIAQPPHNFSFYRLNYLLDVALSCFEGINEFHLRAYKCIIVNLYLIVAYKSVYKLVVVFYCELCVLVEHRGKVGVLL